MLTTRTTRLIATSLRCARCTSGQVATMFALAFIPLAGAAGVAIDYARVEMAVARVQSAVDETAVAAVGQASSSRSTFASNMISGTLQSKAGITLGTTTATTNADGSVTVSQAATIKMTLTSFWRSTVSFTRTTTAGQSSTTTSNNVCLLVLDPTATQSFLVNSGATIDAPNCEIDVKSTANPAAILNASTTDRKSTRLNSSHIPLSRMPSSA